MDPEASELPADYAEIAYRESERLIDTQIGSINELRSRTGLLLAATAVTGSFLGAAALDRGDLNAWGVLALIAFGVGIWASLVVLRPSSRGYTFVMGPTKLLKEAAEGRYASPADMRSFLAKTREEHWNKNQERIEGLFKAFRIATYAVAAQVLLWVLELAT